MVDFYEQWFTKFVPPDFLLDENDILQVNISRDCFLNCFTIQDVTDLEFILNIDSNTIKVIKTKDISIVEACLGI